MKKEAKEYTIAYSARRDSGWADRAGNLFGCVVETFDDKETAERIAADLNKKIGYQDFLGAFLTFYVEEKEIDDEV